MSAPLHQGRREFSRLREERLRLNRLILGSLICVGLTLGLVFGTAFVAHSMGKRTGYTSAVAAYGERSIYLGQMIAANAGHCEYLEMKEKK